jgi:hypothetical protein
MDSSVLPKDEIWFLRVCHHISNAVYLFHVLVMNSEQHYITYITLFIMLLHNFPLGARRMAEVWLCSLFTSAFCWDGWSAPRSSRFSPPGKETVVPIAQRAGHAPGPAWTGAEYSSLPGLKPGTVQPVAGCYTDYTFPTTMCIMHQTELISSCR